MNHDVFISYSSRNPEVAQAICHILEEARIKCWIAPRNIPAGSEYGDLIDDAIIACKVFLFIYSSDSVNSVWCKGELNVAFSENKIIIPYRIDTTPLKGAMRVMLNARHWLDAYPDYETQFSSLVEAINRVLGKPSTPDIPSAPTIPEKKPDNSKQNITEKVSYVSLTPRTFQVKGVEFKMIPVEGGTFTMGATSEQGNDANSNEKPAHRVTLRDYYIGETEVTQALWQAVMGDNPSYFQGDLQRPVEQVSWNDCQEFIKKLNALTGRNFRLPTEAEWEYAARGGNKSNGYKYAGSNTIGNVAWYESNSKSKTHPVKGKQANELGLYDMSGNVWEWCSDWYKGEYYKTSPQMNPTGPESGGILSSLRVYRGGSWSYYARYCRVSCRYCGTPGNGDYGLGLRLAVGSLQ